jgi:hypothetical protein
MKEATRLKTLRAFFYTGLVLLITGLILEFVSTEFHAGLIFMLSLGVMWTFIGFQQIHAFKKNVKNKV